MRERGCCEWPPPPTILKAFPGSTPDMKIMISDAHHSNIMIMLGSPSRKNGPQSCQAPVQDNWKLVSLPIPLEYAYKSKKDISMYLEVTKAYAAPKYPHPNRNMYR